MSILIVGISGKKRTGKDTVAQFIRELYYPTPVHKIAFADALKDEVARSARISLDFIEKNKESFRLILQGWGSDFRRNLCNKNYWIEKWCQKILKIDDESIIVTPDVRFQNEFDAIKQVGGYILRVVRFFPAGEAPIDNHISESELDEAKFDEYIYNSGSLEELKQKTKNTLIKCISQKVVKH